MAELHSSNANSLDVANGPVFIGSRVKTEMSGRWWAGTVTAIHHSAKTASIAYDDGDRSDEPAREIYVEGPFSLTSHCGMRCSNCIGALSSVDCRKHLFVAMIGLVVVLMTFSSIFTPADIGGELVLWYDLPACPHKSSSGDRFDLHLSTSRTTPSAPALCTARERDSNPFAHDSCQPFRPAKREPPGCLRGVGSSLEPAEQVHSRK